MRGKITHLIDLINRPKGKILQEGFLKGHISPEMLDFEILNSNLTTSLPLQFVLDRIDGHQILDRVFKSNPNLKSSIVDYGCQTDFDICYYFGTENINENVHRNSQLWHHDSVGRRLKLFIGLNSGWITYLFKGSHLVNNFFNSTMSYEQRKSLSNEMDNHENAVRVDLEKGDCVIFDTNGLHKGHTKAPYTGEVLIFEFSNFLKKNWMGKVGKRDKLHN
jgi:hypothetical protein